MITQQLVEYLRVQLRAGVSKEALTKALITQGWGESDIAEAFASIEGVGAPQVAPPPAPKAKSRWPMVVGIVFIALLLGAGVVFVIPSLRFDIISQFHPADVSSSTASLNSIEAPGPTVENTVVTSPQEIATTPSQESANSVPKQPATQPAKTTPNIATNNPGDGNVVVLLHHFRASPNTGNPKSDAAGAKDKPIVAKKVISLVEFTNKTHKSTSGSIDWGDGTVEKLKTVFAERDSDNWMVSAYIAEHTYASAGRYTVTVSSATGVSASSIVQVFSDTPSIAITAPSSGTAPTRVNIGSKYSVQWSANNIPANYRFAVFMGNEIVANDLPSSARSYSLTVQSGASHDGVLEYTYQNGDSANLKIEAYPEGGDANRILDDNHVMSEEVSIEITAGASQ